jgi:hypothetical protein
VDVCLVIFNMLPAGADDTRVYEVYLDLLYNAAPVVAITGPASPVLLTQQPTVTWSYSDSEGDAQERYRVKVLKTPYGNPDAPPASYVLYDSGEVVSSAASHRLVSALPNGVAYFYVKAADAGSNGRYGAWALATITIQVDPPGIPAVVATADNPNQRIALLLNGTDNLLRAMGSNFGDTTRLDVDGWVAVTNCAVAQAGTVVAKRALRMRSTAGGTMTARTGMGDPLVRGYPVAALRPIAVGALVQAAASARRVRAYIEQYNSAARLLSTTFGTVVLDVVGRWTARPTVSLTTAATCAFVKVGVEVQSTGAANEDHYVTEVSLRYGTRTLWTRGGLVGGDNLLALEASSFETGTGRWQPLGGTVTLSQQTPASYPGGDGIRALGVSNSVARAFTSPLSPAVTGVTVGRRYSSMARSRTAGTVRLVQAGMQWLKSRGLLILDTLSRTAVETASALATTYVEDIATAPALSASVSALVKFLLVGAAERHDVDAVSLAWGWSDRYLHPLVPRQRVEVQRSVDGGTTWQAVPRLFDAAGVELVSLDGVQLDEDQRITAYDYEAPRETSLVYRARTFMGVDESSIINSDWFVTSVRDTFTRSDSSVTMGTAETGQVWAPNSGVWGITRHLAYSLTGVQSTTVVDTGYADCVIEVTLFISGDAGPCFRSTDDNNNWVWSDFDSKLYKRVAGAYTLVGTGIGGGMDGGVIRVVLDGSTITVYRNGVLLVTASDSFNASATSHGLRDQSGGVARFDNFSVDPPTGAVLITPDNQTYLRSLTDPSVSISLCHADTEFASTSDEDIVVYEPRGRADPVIYGGTVRSEVFGALRLFFLDDSEWDAFEALRRQQEVVLLQTCFGDSDREQFYLRLGPTRSVVRLTSDDMHAAQFRRVEVAAREVAAPV